MGHDIFISHSTEDKTVARDICGELEDRGLEVWIAPRDIKGGENYKVAIYEAIRDAEAVLLLMSEHANQSDHTEREVDIADDYDVPIIPVVIEDAEIPIKFKYMLTAIQRLEVDNPPTEGDYNRVVRSIITNTDLSLETNENQRSDQEVATTETEMDETDGMEQQNEEVGSVRRDKDAPTSQRRDRGRRSRESEAGEQDEQADSVNDKNYWPTYQSRPTRIGYHPTASGPKNNPVVRWTFETNNSVDSTPVVAEEVVYVWSKDCNLYAINANSGTEQWRFETGGALSVPTVIDGTVYFGSSDGNLYALDADTGTEKWTVEIGLGKGCQVSPAVVNGTVYVIGDDGKACALNANTGETRWTTDMGYNPGTSPAVADGMLYIGINNPDGNYMYALDTDSGREHWNFETRDKILSTPAVADGNVYFGCNSSVTNSGDNIYALEANTGSKQWSFETPNKGESIYSPAVADGTVYFANSLSQVYALDADNGAEQWNFEVSHLGNMGFSSPAVADGVVYVGCKDGKVYALNATDGAEEWTFETDLIVRSAPSVANGTVFTGSADNHVYALEESETQDDGQVNERTETETGRRRSR